MKYEVWKQNFADNFEMWYPHSRAPRDSEAHRRAQEPSAPTQARKQSSAQRLLEQASTSLVLATHGVTWPVVPRN